MNAVKIFGATRDLGPDFGLVESGLEREAHFVNVGFAFSAFVIDPLLNVSISGGVEPFECQILEFPSDPGNTQPVRHRRIDVQTFLGHALLCFRRQSLQRAHIVQPVCELDQDDTQVVNHGEKHFSKVFGLSFCV